jgi:phenylacetate-CoA oxygenase PaaJ subunit
VVNNLLINIGQGVLSDLGGIYTLGESPGTVISGNVMHEVRPYQGYGAGAWGMYNDEATTGVLWENNVVVGTDSGGYLLHYGRNNTVRSNLLAYGDRSEVRVTKTDPLTKLAFNNNLLIPKNTAPFVGFATAPDVVYAMVEADSVRGALQEAGFGPVRVTLRRAPAWTTDWISAEGRRKLHAYGIAPPGPVEPEAPGVAVPIRIRPRGVDCPRCGSAQTERLSAFGSTACKAMYRCLACREPFEHFKPI